MEEILLDCNTPAPRQGRGRLRLPAALVGTLVAMVALLLAASTASASGAPGAPTGLVAAPGNGKLVAGWNPPESNGGADITSYTVEYKASTAADRPGNFNDPLSGWVTVSENVTGTDAEITGLTNSVAYDVRVRASNSAGHGQWSDAASATPNEDVVWAAILTVDVNKYNYFGCNRVFFSHDREFDECSVALTEDEFEFAGATYRWTQFLDKASPQAMNQSDHAGLSDSTPVPPDSPLRRGKMQFGDITLSLDNTDHVGWWPDRQYGDGFNVFHPSARATQNWVEGQKVPLNLQVAAPVVPAVEPSPQPQVLQPTTLTLTVDKATVSRGRGRRHRHRNTGQPGGRRRRGRSPWSPAARPPPTTTTPCPRPSPSPRARGRPPPPSPSWTTT